MSQEELNKVTDVASTSKTGCNVLGDGGEFVGQFRNTKACEWQKTLEGVLIAKHVLFFLRISEGP